MLYYIALYSNALHYIAVYCIVLQFAVHWSGAPTGPPGCPQRLVSPGVLAPTSTTTRTTTSTTTTTPPLLVAHHRAQQEHWFLLKSRDTTTGGLVPFLSLWQPSGFSRLVFSLEGVEQAGFDNQVARKYKLLWVCRKGAFMEVKFAEKSRMIGIIVMRYPGAPTPREEWAGQSAKSGKINLPFSPPYCTHHFSNVK